MSKEDKRFYEIEWQLLTIRAALKENDKQLDDAIKKLKGESK